MGRGELPCPGNWEYQHLPDYQATLTRRTEALLLAIRASDNGKKLRNARDTRAIHGQYFVDLTPDGFPYFAGKYRGEPFRCLEDYEVGVPGDAVVGHTAATIPAEMDEFSSRLAEAIKLLDYELSAPNVLFDEPSKLLAHVRVVVALFVEFLEIHPYANGNGHMARFLMLALFGRHDIYPSKAWSIDPRPADPPYTNLIKAFRQGNEDPLVLHVINSL